MFIFESIKNLFDRLFIEDSDNMLFYLSQTEALPCPLLMEEENELINKLNTKEKEFAKAKLIEHNIRLVVYIAKKFENTQTDIEDLISIGSIGLIKAVNSFAPEKNIKLATYASRCIENEILMHLRKIVKQKSEISLEEPLNIDSDGNELVLEDILSQEKDNVAQNMENEIEKEILKKLLTKLSSKEQLIITMRYGLDGNEEKTQKEVADILRISQSYISRIEKKILTKLKKDMLKIF
ncbi:MAG: RNA polymerase sporulation sigma factor SigK [Clostridia bacterium]|nr:RNA polymerase sporulation sigma factor SigK [Clostridia bacterium]